MNKLLYAGIDGGATHCRVRIETIDGVLLGEGKAGSTNPSHGFATVEQSILTAIHVALNTAGLQPEAISSLIVGAGIAGLHLPQYQRIMQSWQHPFAALYLTDDLTTAALGAHNGEDGAVIIVGTGFSATSIVNNTVHPIGGHGFLMADYCSGSWIGFQAVQAVLLALDGLASPTLLSQLLKQRYPCEHIADALLGATASEYGRLAPLVFEAANQGDEAADKILNKSAHFINRVVVALNKNKPPRLALLGGIVTPIKQRLDESVLQQVSPALFSAQQGAICFAKSKHQ